MKINFINYPQTTNLGAKNPRDERERTVLNSVVTLLHLEAGKQFEKPK